MLNKNNLKGLFPYKNEDKKLQRLKDQKNQVFIELIEKHKYNKVKS